MKDKDGWQGISTRARDKVNGKMKVNGQSEGQAVFLFHFFTVSALPTTIIQLSTIGNFGNFSASFGGC